MSDLAFYIDQETALTKSVADVATQVAGAAMEDNVADLRNKIEMLRFEFAHCYQTGHLRTSEENLVGLKIGSLSTRLEAFG